MAGDEPLVQAPIDIFTPEFGDLYDELPLWSAPFGQLLLEQVPLREGMTIVDVGAGTGFLSMELAQRCGPSSIIYAVDLWPSALARLRRKLAGAGVTNVVVREQDAGLLDLAEGSVDLVVSNLGINNFENAPAVLAACFRLLEPGGRLLLSTNLVGHMAELYDAYREVLLSLGRADRLPVLEAQVAHRATVEGVQAQLAAAGFAPGTVARGSFRMRFASGEALMRHYFIRFGFLPGWIEIAGEDLAEQALRALATRLGGPVALTIPMACIEGVR